MVHKAGEAEDAARPAESRSRSQRGGEGGHRQGHSETKGISALTHSRLLNIEKRLCHQAKKVKPKNVQKYAELFLEAILTIFGPI